MRLHPISMVRPDDLEVFTLNIDGCTYTIERSKAEFPNSHHNEYSLRRLELSGFYPLFNSPYCCEKEYVRYFQEMRLLCLQEIQEIRDIKEEYTHVS